MTPKQLWERLDWRDLPLEHRTLPAAVTPLALFVAASAVIAVTGRLLVGIAVGVLVAIAAGALAAERARRRITRGPGRGEGPDG